jgi:hypothetical protein
VPVYNDGCIWLRSSGPRRGTLHIRECRELESTGYTVAVFESTSPPLEEALVIIKLTPPSEHGLLY